MNRFGFSNINSNLTVEENIVGYCLANVGFLVERWQKTPAFLVDEDLMDYLYPPKRRMHLNEECVKEVLLKRKELKEKEKSIFDDLEKCLDEERFFNSLTVATGLFKKSLTDKESKHIEDNYDFNISKGASIFICPERIEHWVKAIAKDLKAVSENYTSSAKLFETLFAKILFHELAHAYMDLELNSSFFLRRGGEIGGRLIEEGLANALAYSRFNSNVEKAIVVRAIVEQPLYYRSYSFWVGLTEWELKKICFGWKRNFYGPPSRVRSLQNPFVERIFWRIPLEELAEEILYELVL